MAARRRTGKTTSRRRRTSRGKKWGLGLLLLLLAILSGSGVQYYYSPVPVSGIQLETVTRAFGNDADPSGQNVFVATVLRAVDGDTLIVLLNGKTERVRMLNVDTPESVHPDAAKNTAMGKIASEFTRRELMNRQVRLECPPDEERDRFGRLLAYVISENENFNVRLVREGLSPYYTEYGRSRYYDGEFRSAEKDARAAERGIWAGSSNDPVAMK